MANVNAQMAEFADNLWQNYIKPKYKDDSKNALSFYRAEVVSNDGNNKLTIKRPYDEPYQVSCTDGMADATVGMQVLVLRFGNDVNNSNHLVVSDGEGSRFGGGGGGGMAENGLPAGGTAGQFLIKDSNVNYDASWQTINLDRRYIHEQGVSASVWTVNHNMNCYPSVTVVDSTLTEVVGQIQYTNANTLTITFTASFKGTAYLN